MISIKNIPQCISLQTCQVMSIFIESSGAWMIYQKMQNNNENKTTKTTQNKTK